jgi:hypothetical protein
MKEGLAIANPSTMKEGVGMATPSSTYSDSKNYFKKKKTIHTFGASSVMSKFGIVVPSSIKVDSSGPSSIDAAMLKLKKYHPLICTHAISPPLLIFRTIIFHWTTTIPTDIDPTYQTLLQCKLPKGLWNSST